MNNQTKRITEGAMMVALVGVMLFVNRQFANMIEFFMYWILTFPILIYTAKHGLRYGILTAVCMLLLSLMIASPTTLCYLISDLMVGVLYGYGIQKHWKNGTLLSISGIITLITGILTTIVFAAFFGYDPAEDIEMVRMLLEFMNISLGSIKFSSIVTGIVILVAVLTAVLQTLCIHMIAQILLKRLKIETVPMKSIFDLQVPKWCGFAIIIIWILFLCRNVLKLNQEISTAIMLIFLCAFIFAIGYGAFTCMTYAALKQSKLLMLAAVVGVFIIYVQDVIAVIGIIDMLFSLRERMKRGVIYG